MICDSSEVSAGRTHGVSWLIVESKHSFWFFANSHWQSRVVASSASVFVSAVPFLTKHKGSATE